MRNGNEIPLKDVRVVEDMKKNIISIGRILDDGGMLFGKDNSLIVKYKGNLMQFRKSMKDGLYYLKADVMPARTERAYSINSDDTRWRVVEKEHKGKPPMQVKTRLRMMNRTEAHEKWGHGGKDHLDKTAKYYGIKLCGKLQGCTGCGNPVNLCPRARK